MVRIVLNEIITEEAMEITIFDIKWFVQLIKLILNYETWYTGMIISHLFLYFRYTSKGSTAYAIVLSWPKTNTLTLGSYTTSTSSTTVTMLGVAGNLNWKKNPTMGIDVQFSMIPISQLPSTDAWVLKIM